MIYDEIFSRIIFLFGAMVDLSSTDRCITPAGCWCEPHRGEGSGQSEI